MIKQWEKYHYAEICHGVARFMPHQHIEPDQGEQESDEIGNDKGESDGTEQMIDCGNHQEGNRAVVRNHAWIFQNLPEAWMGAKPHQMGSGFIAKPHVHPQHQGGGTDN